MTTERDTVSGDRDYRIRFDTMAREDIQDVPDWRGNLRQAPHPAVLAMVRMLEIKSIEVLFEDFVANHLAHLDPQTDSFSARLTELLTEARSLQGVSLSKTEQERKSIVRNQIKDLLEQDIFHTGGSVPFQLYYITPGMYEGVNLNQNIEIPLGHQYFPLLFVFKLGISLKRNDSHGYLLFHLNHTFGRDKKKFKLFLLQLPTDDNPSLAAFLSEWIRQNLNKKKRSGKPKAKLSDYFDEPDKVIAYVKAEFGELPQPTTSSGKPTKKKGKNLNAIRVGLTMKKAIEKVIASRKMKHHAITWPKICDLLVEIGIISSTDDHENFQQYLRRPKKTQKVKISMIPSLFEYLTIINS